MRGCVEQSERADCFMRALSSFFYILRTQHGWGNLLISKEIIKSNASSGFYMYQRTIIYFPARANIAINGIHFSFHKLFHKHLRFSAAFPFFVLGVDLAKYTMQKIGRFLFVIGDGNQER